MRTIKFLLQKEFRQIFRNKSIVAMILVVPIVQLLLLPLAADYEVKNINISVVDHDHSSYSQKLISKISASAYFELVSFNPSYKDAFKLIEVDKSDLILQIPQGFEKNLIRENEQKLFIAVNAINGTKANLGGSYLADIIKDFNGDIRTQLVTAEKMNTMPTVEIINSNWFNPFMNYNLFMVPGILAVLLTMVGGYLAALNIVKEKEAGTIEQINVTPIKKHHFIIGKLVPFWVLGLVMFTIGFCVSRFVYGIVPVGSIALLYGFVAVYLLSVLGFGLLISTFCDTQQQAMFIAFFFMMIFIMMSGLFTSIDGMPDWAYVIARLNPVSYMIDVMRMVVLKGSTFSDVKYNLGIILGFAIVLNGWAVLNYKKTT